MRPSTLRPLLFALAFGPGLLACDKAPAPETKAETKAGSAVAKAPATPAEAAPAVEVELAPNAPPADAAKAPPAEAAPADEAAAPAEGTPAAAPGDKAPPAEAAPAAEAEVKGTPPSDTKQRAGSTPKSGRKVAAFTDCQPSETYADGRCFSSQTAACEHLGCEGTCLQMKSMPPQARCGK